VILHRELGQVLAVGGDPLEAGRFARVRRRRGVRAVAGPSDLQRYIRRAELRRSFGVTRNRALDERLELLGIRWRP
jgi:hypothetical protein